MGRNKCRRKMTPSIIFITSKVKNEKEIRMNIKRKGRVKRKMKYNICDMTFRVPRSPGGMKARVAPENAVLSKIAMKRTKVDGLHIKPCSIIIIVIIVVY